MKLLSHFLFFLFFVSQVFAAGGGAGAGAGAAGSGGSAAAGAGGASAGSAAAATGAAASAQGGVGGPGNSSVGAASAATGATGGTLIPTGNAYHYSYLYTDVTLLVSDVNGVYTDWETISVSEPGQTKDLTFSPLLVAGTDYQLQTGNTAPGFSCTTSESGGTTSADNEAITTTLECFSRFDSGNLSSIWPRSVAPGTELKLSGDNLAEATVWIDDEQIPLLSQSAKEIKLTAPDLNSDVHKLDVLIPGEEEESYFLTYNGIQASAIAGGLDTRCALLENGQISCWGWRNSGGFGTTYQEIDMARVEWYVPSAIAVTPADSAQSISTGTSSHTCYIDKNSQVHCFGGNYYGGIYTSNAGNNIAERDVTIPNTLGAKSVSVGIREVGVNGSTTKSCAVMADSSVQCWSVPAGLGIEVTTDVYLASQSMPTSIVGFDDVAEVRLSSSDDNICALRKDGRIQCVGNNEVGQLGDGTTTSASSPVFVQGIDNAISLSYTGKTGCAILSNGNAKCWGQNTDTDFMGIGASQYTSTPVEIHSTGGLTGSVAMSRSDDLVCAANDIGNLVCWGSSQDYPAEWFSEINSKAFITDVSSNFGFGWCFLELGGGVRCSTPIFGADRVVYNGKGLNPEPGMRALGRNLYYNSPMAVSIPSLDDIQKVAASNMLPAYFSREVCALDHSGDVFCWGRYTGNRPELYPQQVNELSSIVDIAFVFSSLMAVDSDGSLLRWDGETLTQIASNVTQLSNSGDCFVNTGGDVECLISQSSSNFYVVESGGDDFVQVSENCALRASGKVGCWQSGDFAAVDVLNTDGSNLDSVEEIRGMCARLASGQVDCWEYNSSSELYKINVSPAISDISELVNTPEAVVCGKNGEGEIMCYGDSTNYSGIFGVSIPVEYTFEGYFELEVGLAPGSIKTATINGTNACAVLQDNKVSCWGENAFGGFASSPNAGISYLERHIPMDTWRGIYYNPLR